jgi:hypothetical protein
LEKKGKKKKEAPVAIIPWFFWFLLRCADFWAGNRPPSYEFYCTGFSTPFQKSKMVRNVMECGVRVRVTVSCAPQANWLLQRFCAIAICSPVLLLVRL